MRYIVNYRINEEASIKIGEFYRLKDLQKFIPDLEGITKIEKNGYQIPNFLKESIEELEIKFFNSMVQNCERFGDKISSHVHHYELIKIE